MKKNENGFGALHILLLVVILGIVGFAGWTVWSSNNKAEPKRESTPNIVNTSSDENKVTTDSAESKTNQTKYFEIKELGVKFVQTEAFEGLYYVMGNNDRTAYFSNEELKNTACAADKTSTGALTRYKDSDFEDDEVAKVLKESAKQIDEYYFYTVKPQAMCSEDATIQEKADKLSTEISKNLISALQKSE